MKWCEVSEDKNNNTAADAMAIADASNNLPSLSLALDALSSCHLDQRDRVQTVYKTIMKQDYNHYDFWLKVISACHDYAMKSNQMVKMVSAVVEWSKTDKIAFESEEDVIAHWSSLTERSDGITFHTLFKFAKMLKFQWPQEVYDKQGYPTGKPLVNLV